MREGDASNPAAHGRPFGNGPRKRRFARRLSRRILGRPGAPANQRIQLSMRAAARYANDARPRVCHELSKY
ncbi:hypothetical protein [Burkholderia pseudomallei]|uniref:hypothetical protein n=1 Tax=Burkholderia pseudomallei TaxID=28450 RepID=UPI00016ADB52|nr:hypothetical protein [Burkholderia pseudomallei]QGS81430.1 hypothetical protein PMC2000_22990 [Burkholderia pseudomallei]